MRIKDMKYSVTFARRGLLHHESVKLADLYVDLQDWSKVRQQALISNLLQARTLSTSKKVCTEVISRLKTLNVDELGLLVSGTREEQCFVLWLAVCKRYRFVYEFAVEVLREKFLRVDLELTAEDFNRFFNAKAEWHDELASLSSETQKKVRQTVFRMMREAKLLTKQNTILPVFLSNRFLKAVCKQSKDYLFIFSLSDTDVRALAK